MKRGENAGYQHIFFFLHCHFKNLLFKGLQNPDFFLFLVEGNNKKKKKNQVVKQEVDNGGPEFSKRHFGPLAKAPYQVRSGCDAWFLRRVI